MVFVGFSFFFGATHAGGFEAFESSLLPVPPVVMQNRLWLQACMEGPDVYCNDTWLCDPATSATKDGNLNSVNGFGRLEIEAYPYCLKVFWDGAGHDHAELPSWNHHAPRIQEFLSMQQQPEVKRMRNVRQWIRGAAESGQLLYLVKTWVEQRTRQVPDGQDSEGNAKTKTEHYEVHYTGTHGLLSVCGDYGAVFFFLILFIFFSEILPSFEIRYYFRRPLTMLRGFFFISSQATVNLNKDLMYLCITVVQVVWRLGANKMVNNTPTGTKHFQQNQLELITEIII